MSTFATVEEDCSAVWKRENVTDSEDERVKLQELFNRD